MRATCKHPDCGLPDGECASRDCLRLQLHRQPVDIPLDLPEVSQSPADEDVSAGMEMLGRVIVFGAVLAGLGAIAYQLLGTFE